MPEGQDIPGSQTETDRRGGGRRRCWARGGAGIKETRDTKKRVSRTDSDRL